MSRREERMLESAETHLQYNDQDAHDAIKLAIDDVAEAKRLYPNKIEEITQAIRYAENERRFSGH